MIVSADWVGCGNECAIAKSVVDPKAIASGKAIAFGGVPGPLVHWLKQMVQAGG
jgi:hypothetical protein